MPSPDPPVRENVAAIREVHRRPPAGAVVPSVDEKTGLQALAPRCPDRPAGPGRPGRRREFEYTRHGPSACGVPSRCTAGAVLAACRGTRPAADLGSFMDMGRAGVSHRARARQWG